MRGKPVVNDATLEDARKADVLVSKGQGNFEGLSGCGLNIFHLFLCKCDAFMQRFHVPQFTGIMTREGREARFSFAKAE